VPRGWGLGCHFYLSFLLVAFCRVLIPGAGLRLDNYARWLRFNKKLFSPNSRWQRQKLAGVLGTPGSHCASPVITFRALASNQAPTDAAFPGPAAPWPFLAAFRA
jgi:hypothetical protein